MPIPKIMHFIWIGVNPISDDRLRVIRDWYDGYNENFKICFWIDKQGTTRDSGENILNQQKARLREIGIRYIRNIREDMVGADSWEIIRYEIDRLRPNYGAASDLMRYEILYKYGGVYIDSDVLPPADTQASLYSNNNFWENYNECYVYRQGSANDIIFSARGSRGIARLTFIVHQNYQVRAQRDEEMVGFHKYQEAYSCIQAYNYSTNSYLKYYTLRKTGPNVLNSLYGFLLLEDNPNREILDLSENTLHVDESQIRRPLRSSARSWLNLPVKPITMPELSVNLVIDSIRFEIQHFGILRLHDHISDLEALFRFEEYNRIDCYRRLNNALNNLINEIENEIEYDTIILQSYALQGYALYIVHTQFNNPLNFRGAWNNTCTFPVVTCVINPNKAMSNVLIYFDIDIKEMCTEIFASIDNNQFHDELLYKFNNASQVYLDFISCLLDIVTQQLINHHQDDVMLEICREANTLVSRIKNNAQLLQLDSLFITASQLQNRLHRPRDHPDGTQVNHNSPRCLMM